MPKVLIAPTTLAKIEGKFLQVLREAGFEIVFPKKQVQLTEDDLLQELKGISASLAGSEPYTRKVIEASPDLRIIARAGVGYDAVDVPASTERGVAVCITPGSNQDAVAEHTLAVILGVAKNIVSQHNKMKAGQWPRQANLPLRGRSLGVAGLGRIGKAVALRGAAFGMRVLAYEPFPDKSFIDANRVQLMSFEQLLAESDFLTLHLPLSAESKHLINRKTLALMKPTSFLINTARGGLVCEADLLEVLRSKRIAGAALDVFEEEPPGKNPLFDLDNVLLTAHTAGVDTQSRDDMALQAAQAVVTLSRGGWPALEVVNADVRSKFKWK